MTPLIIHTPPFLSGSGGITALHKLCHLLRLRGVEAFVWIDKPRPTTADCHHRWNTPIANGQVDPSQGVVIYPEIVIGDPLRGKRVVRWLLNRPGVMGGNGVFGPDDLVLHFQPAFGSQADPRFRLTVYETWPELNTPGSASRTGGCFVIRKGNRKPRMPETDGMLELPWLPANEYAPIFQSKSTFVSYDSATFLSLQAALCGCLSVVVPDPGVTGAQWRREHPIMTYGVAYGFGELEWARATMPLVPQALSCASVETELQISALLASLDLA